MLGVQSTRTAAHRAVHSVSAAASISPPSKASKLSTVLPNQKTQNLRSRTRQSKTDLDSPPDSSTTWTVPRDDEKKEEEIEEEEADDAGKVEMLTSEVAHESEHASIDPLSNVVNPSSLSVDPPFINEDKDSEEVDTFNFVDFGDDAGDDDGNGKGPSDSLDEKRELSSKFSTPLSELSPLPTYINASEDSDPLKKDADETVEQVQTQPTDSLTLKEDAKTETTADPINGSIDNNGHSDKNMPSVQSRPQSPPKYPQKTLVSLSKDPSSQNPLSPPSHPSGSSPLSSTHDQGGPPSSPLAKAGLLPQEAKDSTLTPSLPGPSTIAQEKLSQNQVSHRKVSLLLELNNELFTACITLQSQNISANDVDYQTLSKKLQSNLAWLESQIDKTRANTDAFTSLPELTPPSISPSALAKIKSFDLIQTLYSQLPTLFAKDVARRECRMSVPPSSTRATPVPVTTPAPLSSAPSASSPGKNSTGRVSMSPLGTDRPLPTSSSAGVKRERPQSRDRESPSAAKRRDTGEGKSTTGLMLPPPSTPSLSTLQTGESVHSVSAMEGGSSPRVAVPSAMGSSTTNSINRPSSSSSVHSVHSVHSVNNPPTSSNSASGMYSRQQTPQASGAPNQLGGLSVHANEHLSMVGNAANNGPGTHNPASPAPALSQLSTLPSNISEQQQQQASRLRLLQYRQAMQQQQQQSLQQQHAGQPGQGHVFPSSLQSQQAAQSQPQFAHQQQFTQHLQRQMSPPSTSGGPHNINAFGPGSQQTQVSLGVPQQALQGGTQGAVTSSGSIPNVMTSIGAIAGGQPNAMQRVGPNPQYFNILRDPSHPLTQSLNAQIPGFSRLPIQQQLHMMQVAMKQHQMQRQAQQVQSSGMEAQRSTMMANNMQSNQFRQSGAPSQLQQQAMSQQPQPGANQQLHVSPTDNASPFPGVGSSMSNRGQPMPINSALTGGNNPSMAHMNMSVQQRQQLFAMQQQVAAQRGAAGIPGSNVVNPTSGNYANPTMMSPQMLLAAQQAHAERQRLMQHQQQQAQAQAPSMNPSLSAGSVSGLDNQQFPALRSNPSMPGIARSMRSPSVTDLTAGTPRIGGRMLPGQMPGQIGGQSQSDDYNRALLQAQAQRSAQQLQQQALLQGIQPQQLSMPQHQMQSGAWPSHMATQQQMQHLSGGAQAGGGTHLTGQMQNDDYSRALLQAQANRNAQQLQQQALMQGVQPQQLSIQQNQPMQTGAWPAGALQQQQQQFNPTGQNVVMASAYGNNTNATSSSSFDQGSWPPAQQHPSPVTSMHGSEHGTAPRQTSATPTPLQQHSPVAQATEFDNMINW